MQSPLAGWNVSGTMRPMTFAPRQRCSRRRYGSNRRNRAPSRRVEIDDLPFRRQRIDAILDDFGTKARERCSIVLAPILALEQRAHPGDLALETHRRRRLPCSASARRSRSSAWRYISCVRIWHFERLAVRTDHCRVQRLIVIAFRACDVVVELAGDVRPCRSARRRARRSSWRHRRSRMCSARTS